MKRITRAKAVKLFCMTCFGWTGSNEGTGPGDAVKMVRECESKNCYLYNFRTGRETTPGLPKKFSPEQLEVSRKRIKSRQKIKKVSTYVQI